MGLLDSVKKNKTDKKASVAPKGKAATPASLNTVLLRPLLSEKTTDQEAMGQYTFEVRVDANKWQIKEDIARIYGVMPKKVRVMNLDGKKSRTRYGHARRKHSKKAIVILPKGKKIEIHEGV